MHGVEEYYLLVYTAVKTRVQAGGKQGSNFSTDYTALYSRR
jgi:hypothetical protein